MTWEVILGHPHNSPPQNVHTVTNLPLWPCSNYVQNMVTFMILFLKPFLVHDYPLYRLDRPRIDLSNKTKKTNILIPGFEIYHVKVGQISSFSRDTFRGYLLIQLSRYCLVDIFVEWTMTWEVNLGHLHNSPPQNVHTVTNYWHAPYIYTIANMVTFMIFFFKPLFGAWLTTTWMM
jgi:hypothetical protein